MEKIRQILKEKGKTQTWLAEKLEVSRQRLTLLLKQEDMMLSTAFKLADVLNIDVNVFRERSDN
ncbi:helix-turn-helix transcriptional regulator [Aerococcaceae bacterium zg-ZUI334]|uniref:helix-turn-helix transcriptional regulator n=1 Tax=Aerococcaceae bacterium zg-252 TaxID=2796928 RepID=UPI001B95EE31|nr:helix-turn-helix transcriptional regulator [Aerococcaceae bacterium zg-ZUI334]